MFKKYFISLLSLIVLCIIAGSYSVYIGQDVNFDLMNYHLYTPYAFLHGLGARNLIPAGIHSFFNPLPDLYFHFVFWTFFNYPKWLAFFMGIPYGVLIWLSYFLAKDFFEGHDYPRFLATCTAATVATAAGILVQVGTTTNDIPLAILSTCALRLGFKFIKTPSRPLYAYGAAFIAGAVAGMKLTSSPFCVALTVAIFIHFKSCRISFKTFLLFALCGVGGFLLTNGYFMWENWHLYHNPIFPYYNHFFKSPYFEPVYVTDVRFFPKNIYQWLFYPFFWAFKPARLCTEDYMQDPRLACAFLAVFIFIGLFIKKRCKTNIRLTVSLVAYLVVGYICWLKSFSMLRYGVMLEVTSSLLLVVLCANLFKGKWAGYASLFVLGGLIYGLYIPDYQHNPFDKQAIVFTDKPTVEDNSLVFLMVQPGSYLIPFLNPNASYMGGFVARKEDYPKDQQKEVALINNLPEQYLQFHFEDWQRRKIAEHDGPLYIVSLYGPIITNPNALARFGLKGDFKKCRPFTTNITIYSLKLALCPVEKIPH